MEQRRGEKILRRFAPQNDKGGAGHSLCHSQHFALSFRAFCAVVLCFFTLSFWAFLRCHPERSEESRGTAALRKDSSSLCSSASEETKYIPPAVQAPYPLVPSSFSKPNPLRWASVWFERGPLLSFRAPTTVILSLSPVILSEAKNLSSRLKNTGSKDSSSLRSSE